MRHDGQYSKRLIKHNKFEYLVEKNILEKQKLYK